MNPTDGDGGGDGEAAATWYTAEEAQLSAAHCVAAGVLVTCEDGSDAAARYALLGLSARSGHLCHFHGFNDARAGPAASAPGTYVASAVATAAREFAEESLQAVGSEAQLLAVLRGHCGACCRELFCAPHVRAFWVHAGPLGRAARDAVCARFQLLRQRPLGPCEREVAALVWAPLREAVAATRAQSPPEAGGGGCSAGAAYVWPVEGGEPRALRGWLTGWVHALLVQPRHPAQRLFRDFCLGSVPCPLRPYTCV
eukprot:m51a1_g8565 hypothetical protein (255) ;mRNA; r:183502-184266